MKKVILHRENAMFYKTENGAHVADVYMSLIYTCELCGANPFDYLTELQRHAPEVAANPASWMPWNYRVLSADVRGAKNGHGGGVWPVAGDGCRGRKHDGSREARPDAAALRFERRTSEGRERGRREERIAVRRRG